MNTVGSGTTVRWPPLVLAAPLAAVAGYLTYNPDLALPWLPALLGAPRNRVAVSIVLFAAAGLALASSSGLDTAAEGSAHGRPRQSGAPALRRACGWVATPLGLGMTVTGLAALLTIGWHGIFRGAAGWFVAVAGMFVIAVRTDRIRDTRLRVRLNRREALFLAVLMAAVASFLVHDLDHWRWSGIPDESFFFNEARSISRGESSTPILSGGGVFGYHPNLSSCYQALFLRLLGANAFAWRLSSVLCLVISLPFVYLLGRELRNRRAGAIAATLLGTSQLALNYAHLGYNNIQTLPLASASWAFLAAGHRRASVTGYLASGVIAGLGWFTYYPARFVFPLAVLLALSLGGFSLRRGDRLPSWALLTGWTATALPLLIHPATYAQMLRQTQLVDLGHDPSASLWDLATWGGIGAKVVQHWFQSLFFGVRALARPFQSNPVIDPISFAFLVAGLWIAALALTRRRPIGFLFLAYVLSALTIGATSQYHTPPVTRLLFLTPLASLLAGVAMDRLFAAIPQSRRGVWLAPTLLACIVAWNVAELRQKVYGRFHGYGDGTTSELIRAMRDLPPDWNVVYLQRSNTYMEGADRIAEQYGLGHRLRYVRGFDSRRVLQVLTTTAPPLAVFYDLQDPGQQATVESAVSKRFPSAIWADTDAGKSWNLRHTLIPQ